MKIIRKLFSILVFIPYYIFEVVSSNMRVAYDILTPANHFSPAIISIPLKPMSDLQLLVLTNLVTMTPGTLTMDVTPDRRQLIVHAMYVRDIDAFVSDFKNNFEPKIRNAF